MFSHYIDDIYRKLLFVMLYTNSMRAEEEKLVAYLCEGFMFRRGLRGKGKIHKYCTKLLSLLPGPLNLCADWRRRIRFLRRAIPGLEQFTEHTRIDGPPMSGGQPPQNTMPRTPCPLPLPFPPDHAVDGKKSCTTYAKIEPTHGQHAYGMN